jgi:catechol 2,3-dioxygenase-like lactoylglutathione lyase family enzyme
MALSITHTSVYCTDLDAALAFYTERLGFEVQDDVPMGPEMRWLTIHGPGDGHDLLLAAVDHHIPAADRQAMREIVAKGDLAVLSRSTTWTRPSSRCAPPGRRSSRSPSTSPTASATPGSATPAATT